MRGSWDRRDGTALHPRPGSLGTRAAWAALIAAAALVRFVPVLQSDFPYGDGGLYVVYIRDLLAAGPVPPLTTTYNGGMLFPYPFLAFEIVAAISRLGPDTLQVMRFLPPLLSTLGVLAFAWLARRLVGSGWPALVATLFYATLPEAYENSILGGGITKSLAALLAILAVAVAADAFRARGPARLRGAVLAGILAGLAQLAHPAGGLMAGVGIGFVLLLAGLTADRIRTYLFVGGLALAVSAPWWLRVLLQLGPAPLVGAWQNGRDPLFAVIAQVVQIAVTGTVPVLLLALWAALAEIVATRRRDLLLLLGWFLAAAILDQRNAYLDVPVPAALLGGAGVAAFAERVRRGLAQRSTAAASIAASARVLVPAGAIVLVAYLALAPGFLGPRDPLRAPDRVAMDAARTMSAPSARFLVITGSPWSADDVSEWFPALTGRVSVATPQGLEWAPAGAFDRAVRANADVQRCAVESLACVEQWAASTGTTFDVLYVAGPEAESSREPEPTLGELLGLAGPPRADCCAPLRASVEASPAWRVVFAGPGGMIAVPRAAPPPSASDRVPSRLHEGAS